MNSWEWSEKTNDIAPPDELPTPPSELPTIPCDDDEAARALYETMSYEEMSECLAESRRQLTDMLTSASLTARATSTQDDVSDVEEPEPNRARKANLNKQFSQAASSGDLTTITRFLLDSETRSFIDIDVKDEDGTTPLIYAACFGKVEVVDALLSAGANPDLQDAFGWSALMWATNNNHDNIVRLLVQYGASAQAKSAKGRTVFDFMSHDNHAIVDLLASQPRDSLSSSHSSVMHDKHGSNSYGTGAYSPSSTLSSPTSDFAYFYPPPTGNMDAVIAGDRVSKDDTCPASPENDERDQEQHLGLDPDLKHDPEHDQDCDDTLSSSIEFCWEKCLPDQMLVFSTGDLDWLLDAIVCQMRLPLESPDDIRVPASAIFLYARFAHYYCTPDLVEQVIHGAVNRISDTIKAPHANLHVLAYWIGNATQLLLYLKRDAGMVVATAESQLILCELITDIYGLILRDIENRIDKVLGPVMLDHEAIPGMDDVSFADDWQRFFRRGGARRQSQVPADDPFCVQMKRHSSSPAHVTGSGTRSTVSPDALGSVLSSMIIVLKANDVHRNIVLQSLAQAIHYISCELFNRILTNKKLLSRSKAMQIRMNLSRLEDWIQQHRLPTALASYFKPTTQLLQLLQCLTQLDDLATFVNTIKSFDLLNALQVKRCVMSYRYEVDEPRLPEEVEKYAMQCAEDTLRHLRGSKAPPLLRSQSTSHRSTTRATPMTRTQSLRQSPGRDPVSHVMESLVSGLGQGEADPEDSLTETKDSRSMLPFVVPTTTDLDENGLAHTIPSIPENWMDKLDKSSL